MLEDDIPGSRTILPDAERLFQMLDQGRLDTVLEHSLIGDVLIEKAHFTTINKLSPPLIAVPGYSFIHKKHQALIPGIAQSLAEMKADGSFEKIRADVLVEMIVP